MRQSYAELCNTITCQPIEPENYSNLLQIQKSSSLNFFKNFLILGLGFFGWCHNKGRFSRFSRISGWGYLAWVPTQHVIFLAQVFFVFF